MDQRDKRHYLFDFVALQMAYEMPLNVFGKHLPFPGQLLNFVLSEQPLSGMIGLHDLINAFRF